MTDDKMTKGERDELRRVVRQDFKVLGEEMKVRRAELLADIEQTIARRFQPSEEAIGHAEEEIAGIVSRASTECRKVAGELAKNADGYDIQVLGWSPPRLMCVPTKREEMRRALIADLDARLADATARVHRQENELLKQLAVGALQSEEARAFLAAIPSVAELVPAARLAELEAQFAEDDQ